MAAAFQIVHYFNFIITCILYITYIIAMACSPQYRRTTLSHSHYDDDAATFREGQLEKSLRRRSAIIKIDYCTSTYSNGTCTSTAARYTGIWKNVMGFCLSPLTCRRII
jgi:hypothetical protein